MNFHTPLSLIQIDYLNKQPLVCLKKKTTLIYRGHIPIVSYYIFSGDVQYLDSNKNEITNPKRSQIIGSYENLNYIPYEYYVIAKTDLKLKIVDRSLLNKMFIEETSLANNCV